MKNQWFFLKGGNGMITDNVQVNPLISLKL